MKKILFIFFLVSNFHVLYSQISADTITFEGNNNSLVTIDTSQPNNIWQIGKPQKIFFDSAFSIPNAIVTDTINSYPVNNLSSFQFLIKEPFPNAWMNPTIPYLRFWHKFDTDSLLDGGYIEISYDGGNTWTNITNSPELLLYSSFNWVQDTIAGGIKAFTGKSPYTGFNDNWNYLTVFWEGWCDSLQTQILDSIVVRFSFKSDNIQTNKEGWMIDYITYGTDYYCFIGVTDLQKSDIISIYPNPIHTSAIFRFDYSKFKKEIQTLLLYDVFGKKVREEKFSSSEFIFERNNLPPGIYFYNIFSAENKEAESIRGKIIIQ